MWDALISIGGTRCLKGAYDASAQCPSSLHSPFFEGGTLLMLVEAVSLTLYGLRVNLLINFCEAVFERVPEPGNPVAGRFESPANIVVVPNETLLI